jgi:hypothetical protein
MGMTALDAFRATVRTLLGDGVPMPADDEGLTRYVVDGRLDLDEFDAELGAVDDLPAGAFGEDEIFLNPGHPRLTEPQMRAVAWLAPVSRRAEQLRAEAGYSCDDPTLQSLARSFETGRWVKSGLVWRVDAPKPRTVKDAVRAVRNLALGAFSGAGGFAMLTYFGCTPICTACPASPIEVVGDILPFTGALAFGFAGTVLLPGLILLVRNATPDVFSVR